MSANLKNPSTRYWVYVLFCENHSYYTGYTNNLAKRYQAHMEGKASKYTRSFKPLYLAQSWLIGEDKALAMRTERFIKQLPKKQKIHLIINPSLLTELYAKVIS